ncbi:homeobox protein 2-like [Physella acuta]|uniref:homeobox protein 2-like n=1 Tax=Physella acuta TaxID=109671 RepID=UPI0027DEA98C|nr:homeobox protein 2-like [Physella acuta]
MPARVGKPLGVNASGDNSSDRRASRTPLRPHTSIGLTSPEAGDYDINFYSSRYKRCVSRRSGKQKEPTVTEGVVLGSGPSHGGVPDSRNTQDVTDQRTHRPNHEQHHTDLTFEPGSTTLRPKSSYQKVKKDFRSESTTSTKVSDVSGIYKYHYISPEHSAAHRHTNKVDNRQALTQATAVQDTLRRRGSGGVTFALPDDTQGSTQVYDLTHDSIYRRMSAPELPPISSRGDKRKTSNNSLNSSGTSLNLNTGNGTKTFSSLKTNYPVLDGGSKTPGQVSVTPGSQNKKKKGPLPRNYSDPSLSGALIAGSSQESISTNLSSMTGEVGVSGSRKYGHRAMSWSTADNMGSQTKLETLIEGQCVGAPHNGNYSNQTPRAPPIYKANSNSSSNNNNNNNNDDAVVLPHAAPGRKDTARYQTHARNKNLPNATEHSPRGRAAQRSNSEQTLGGKLKPDLIHQSKERAIQRVMSRNLSMDRIHGGNVNKTNPPPKPVNTNMRRANSMAAINNNSSNNNNDDDDFSDDDDFNTRLINWLNIVNSVDEFDTDPQDVCIEYADELPRKDTAVHLVHLEQ